MRSDTIALLAIVSTSTSTLVLMQKHKPRIFAVLFFDYYRLYYFLNGKGVHTLKIVYFTSKSTIHYSIELFKKGESNEHSSKC